VALEMKPEADIRRWTFPSKLSSQPRPLQVFNGLVEIVWMASKVTLHSSQMCLKSGKLFKIGEKNDF